MTGENESDPNGKPAHSPGSKLDKNKLLPFLCFSDFAQALLSVSEVTTYGSKKYVPRGWRIVPDGVNRYSEAMMRHLMAYFTGEEDDKESLLPHLSHACWNLLAVIELKESQRRQEP